MHCPAAISPLGTIPEPCTLQHAVSWVTDCRATHPVGCVRAGDRGEGCEGPGSSAGEARSEPPGLGLDWADVEHREASMLLELQTRPCRGVHVSAGFAVTSALFNFT